jgi:hypothetical protein
MVEDASAGGERSRRNRESTGTLIAAMADVASEDVRYAGCACGKVRLRAEGRPYRAGLCHCLDCRKAHAAPFTAFVIFPADKVSVTGADGRDLPPGALGSFSAAGGRYRRFFCVACGAHVFGRADGSDEIELHTGSFDDPNLWTPTYEAWAKRREDWLGRLPTIRHSYAENRTAAGDGDWRRED